MPSRIFLAVQGPDKPGSMTVVVREDFDTSMNQIFPIQASSSALEERERQLFTALDGRRLMVHPSNVFMVEEDPELEEE